MGEDKNTGYPYDNPLIVYKRKNNRDWPEMAKESGVTVQALIRIAKKELRQLGGIELRTYHRIKMHFGVDLLKWDGKHEDIEDHGLTTQV